jgi:hypothetical protein
MAKYHADSVVIDSQSATVGGYRLLSNQQAINGDTDPVIPGMPVIVIGDNLIARACAAIPSLSAVDGIAFTLAAPTFGCMLRSQGRVTLDPVQWDAVTGEIGGLFPGATYYLGLVPGMLTSAPPFMVGQSVCLIGKAFSPGSLIIEIGAPILL